MFRIAWVDTSVLNSKGHGKFIFESKETAQKVANKLKEELPFCDYFIEEKGETIDKK